MSVVVNEVRRGTYLDSIALMRMTRAVTAIPGVEEAGLMMGTPANVRIMQDAGVLSAEGKDAAPGDLIIAIRAKDRAVADAAIAEARKQLDTPRQSAGGGASAWAPRSLRSAVAATPGANLALISVPGAFAASEARKAMGRGLNILMFSDNVPVEEEVELKNEARERGLLMMGPDCGTAIINGVPLGFANAVPRGDIGIVGASGTGIQEVSCLLANNGGGISHAIGTGGRDLKSEVGGITTLMAIDLLDADPRTKHIVVISKPPAKEVAKAVLERVAKSKKPFTVCFIGGMDITPPAGATLVPTLKAAAEHALGLKLAPAHGGAVPQKKRQGKLVRGLFAGGTLCAEAQVVLRDAGLSVSSNTPIPGATNLGATSGAHTIIDLGDDEYTQGRPHPMIEPAVRDAPLATALADPETGVVLLDIVLGYGASADPAGHLTVQLAKAGAKRPAVIACVTGTEQDPQRRSVQIQRLEQAGVIVAPSAADATAFAVAMVKSYGRGG
jgi:FdrA protein